MGSYVYCGCFGNTITAAILTPAWLDVRASLRPLIVQSIRIASSVNINGNTLRMYPLRSCPGAKCTKVRCGDRKRHTGAVPMALHTNLKKVDQVRLQGLPTITDSQIAESKCSLYHGAELNADQENKFGAIGKVNAPFKLLRVGVDVDEVLGNFLSSLNTFIAEEYLQQHKMSEYHVYDFMKIWRCSQAEANNRVHAFFESEHFNSGISPISGALEALQNLSSYCHIVVVTSRQHAIRQPTLDWIDQHYNGIFKEVHFGNHFALEGEARSKSEICRSVGVEVLIDDNPRYALECAEHGIKVLLFDLHGKYPWSKTEQGPTNSLITRVHSWSEVEQELLALLQ